MIDNRERDTILAALRFYQQRIDRGLDLPDGIAEIATGGDAHDPQVGAEIDALCERLNVDHEIADFVEVLREEHGGTWGEHPTHSLADWRDEVVGNNTRQGYWEWVASKVDEDAGDAYDATMASVRRPE